MSTGRSEREIEGACELTGTGVSTMAEESSSTRQKTGASSARWFGSARKSQPPAPSGTVGPEIGLGGSGFEGSAIVGVAAQELPGQTRGAHRTGIFVGSAGAPIWIRQGKTPLWTFALDL